MCGMKCVSGVTRSGKNVDWRVVVYWNVWIWECIVLSEVVYGYMGEVELMRCSQKMIVAECCCMMCGCVIECWSSVDRISGSDGLMMEVPIWVCVCKWSGEYVNGVKSIWRWVRIVSIGNVKNGWICYEMIVLYCREFISYEEYELCVSVVCNRI